MRIIPAIDIIDGKCVRLTKGDYNTQKVYGEDPVEVAKVFEGFGLQYLHLVDLDAAKSKQLVNLKVLEKIAQHTQLKIDFGGGIQAQTDIETLLNAGAAQVSIGSLAAQQPALFLSWVDTFGAEKICLGADCLKGKIATNAWTESTDIDILEYLKSYSNKGLQYAVVTDIDKDGMLQGPSFGLYEKILKSNPIKLIASGGVSTLQDLKDLRTLGCDGAIVGKAIYEGSIRLQDLVNFSSIDNCILKKRIY